MAATSTLKLVLDDKEYSASIRSAKQGMNDLQQSLQTAGKSFSEVDKQVVEYAKAIGNMDTVAKESKGQLREMSQTLTDLTRVYRQLTDEEKSSDFGKALSSSIETLTERAGEVQDAMGDVQASIKNAASDTRTFDQLSQGAQVALSGFQGLTGAAKLLGIEIGDDVQVIAKLQAAMALTNSLTTIQNALQKESALMQGLSAANTKLNAIAQELLAGNITAATVAQSAFNIAMKAAPWALAVAAIYSGVSAMADYFDATKDAEKASKDFEATIKSTAESLKEIERAVNFDVSIATAVGTASEALLRLRLDAAKTAEALAWNTMQSAPMGTESYKQARQTWEQANDKLNKAYDDIISYSVTNRTFEKNWNSLKSEKEINAAISHFKTLRSEADMGSEAWKKYDDRISQLQAKLSKTGSGSGLGGGGISRGGAVSLTPQYSVAGLTEDLRYLQQEQAKATSVEEWRTYQDAIRSVNDEVKKLKGELSVLGTDNTTGGISISRMLSENVTKRQQAFKSQKLEVKVPAEKEKKNTAKDIGDLIGSVGTIANSLQQIGVEIPEGFSKVLGGMQAVIGILEAIQTIQTVGSILGVFNRGGIVHAASGMVVPGNHFSGDMIPALLNSGEVVLNKAQTYNVAAALQENRGDLHLDTEITAEAIRIILNNNSRRRSRGEYVTTKMRN